MPIMETWQFCLTHLRARVGTDEHGNTNERGASLVEYALLVALIAVICIVAIAFLGQSASSKFSTVGSSVGS
jgi:pilus assembly protein Flp/PilA